VPHVAVDADSNVPEYGEQNGGENVKKKYHEDGALVVLFKVMMRMVKNAHFHSPVTAMLTVNLRDAYRSAGNFEA
jgi:hypothetical protein